MSTVEDRKVDTGDNKTKDDKIDVGDSKTNVESSKILADRLKEATVKMDRMTDTMSQFKVHHEKTLKREREAHEREIKELHKVQRNAVKNGNEVEYDEVTEKINDLKKTNFDQDSSTQQLGKEVVDEYENFVSRNPWFSSNPEMRAVAEGISNTILSLNPLMTVADNMVETENRIRILYSDQFKNTRRKFPTTVEDGVSTVISPGKRNMSFSDLPAEAQAAGKRFVAEKLFDNLEDYAKDFAKLTSL